MKNKFSIFRRFTGKKVRPVAQVNWKFELNIFRPVFLNGLTQLWYMIHLWYSVNWLKLSVKTVLRLNAGFLSRAQMNFLQMRYPCNCIQPPASSFYCFRFTAFFYWREIALPPNKCATCQLYRCFSKRLCMWSDFWAITLSNARTLQNILRYFLSVWLKFSFQKRWSPVTFNHIILLIKSATVILRDFSTHTCLLF